MLSENRQMFLAYQLTRSREPTTGICLNKDLFLTPRKHLTRQPPKLCFASLDEALSNFNLHSDKQTNYSSDLAKRFLQACRAGCWPQYTVYAKHDEYLSELRAHFAVERDCASLSQVDSRDSADISVRVTDDDDTSSADSHYETTSKRRRLEVSSLQSHNFFILSDQVRSFLCKQDPEQVTKYTSSQSLSWQCIDSSQLRGLESDTDRQTIADYASDVRQKALDVLSGRENAHLPQPCPPVHTQLQRFLQYLTEDVSADGLLQSTVSALYHDYRTYLDPGQPCRINLLSHPPESMTDMHAALHRSAPDIEKCGSIFMAAFPRSENGGMMTLLADRAEDILTFPGQQKMGDGSWQPQSGEKHSLTLLETESYGEAIKITLHSLATRWKLRQSSPKDELCFYLAIMNSLPPNHPGAVTYENEMNVLSHPGNMTALKTDHRTSLSTDKQPRMFWDMMGKLYVDPCRPVNLDDLPTSSATCWPLCDETFKGRIESAYAGGEIVPVFEGVNTSLPIVSVPLTYTPAHIEDVFQGAVNVLLRGSSKVWFVVSPLRAGDFKAWLSKKYGPGAVSRLFAKNLRPILSAAEMETLDVRVLFQPVGYTIVTMPGEVYHWTLSLGFSLAEAANFFSSANMSLHDMVKKWKSHVDEVVQDVRQAKAAGVTSAYVYQDRKKLGRDLMKNYGFS